MILSNTDKADLIAESFRSQFTLKHDIVNPRMLDIVDTVVEQYINTNHNNTLNLFIQFEVISYIGSLKRKYHSASITSLHIYSYISHLIEYFSNFFLIIACLNSICSITAGRRHWLFQSQKLDKPLLASGPFLSYHACQRSTNTSLRTVWKISSLTIKYYIRAVWVLVEALDTTPALESDWTRSRGLHEKTKTKYCFVDIVKPFDQVWHYGHIYTLT